MHHWITCQGWMSWLRLAFDLLELFLPDPLIRQICFASNQCAWKILPHSQVEVVTEEETLCFLAICHCMGVVVPPHWKTATGEPKLIFGLLTPLLLLFHSTATSAFAEWSTSNKMTRQMQRILSQRKWKTKRKNRWWRILLQHRKTATRNEMLTWDGAKRLQWQWNALWK